MSNLFILICLANFRNVVDLGQGDHVDARTSHHVNESSQSTVEEESTAYRGYTNPNVQSRSFKILQQSLNYSEASGKLDQRPNQLNQYE